MAAAMLYGHELGAVCDMDVVCSELESSVSSHVPPPLLPPSCEPDQDVITGSSTPMVFTHRGWKPKAGGFQRAASAWQTHRANIPAVVLATITHGAHLHWMADPPPPLWLNNKETSPTHRDFIDKEVAALQQTGALRLYKVSDFGLPCFIGPLFVAEDDALKLRMIWDPRFINAFLRVPRLSLEHLDTLSLLVEELDIFLKLDMTSGYHHVLMAQSFAPYLCCRWQGHIYYWAALPFGLASAPFIFERVMRGMKFVLRQTFHLRFMAYLDDFNFCVRMAAAISLQQLLVDIRGGLSSPLTDIILVMVRFGCSFNVAKLQTGHTVDMVGIQVCSRSMTFSIPTRRREKLVPLLHATIDHPLQPVRHFSKLAGTFISMQAGLKHACSFLWTIHNFIRPWSSQELWGHKIRAPDRLRSRCAFWLARFDEFNGIPIRRKVDYVIQIDAAKQGSGGVLLGPHMQEYSHHDRPVDEQAGHNNTWEFLSSVDALVPFLPLIRHSTIELETDNMFGRSYLRKGGGCKEDLTVVTESLTELLIQEDVDLLRVRYRPGPENVVADAISRFQDKIGDWAIKPAVLTLVHHWIEACGLPMYNLDAFASSMNKVCPRFVSRFYEYGSSYVDFFRANIPAAHNVLWCNPPFCLVGRVLLQLLKGGYSAYLVAPARVMDQGQLWWLPLQHHTIASLVLPPDAFTSISTGHTRGFHPVDYNIIVYYLSFSHPSQI